MPDVRPKHVDSYLCTAFALDMEKPLYVVAFEPNATKETAHHILLYGCEEPGSLNDVWDCGEMNRNSRQNTWDTKDDVPRSNVCGKGSQVIYAWAMDAPKLELPPDVAFRIGKGTSIKYLVLQVHYASVYKFKKDNTTDNSGIVISYTTKKQPKSAGVILLGAGGFIMPRSSAHMETACAINQDIVMHPFAYRTHTHALGTVVSGYVVKRNRFFRHKWIELGRRSPQTPQMFYPVEHPNVLIKKGDVLAARCTMESDRNTITKTGATVQDEMCNFYLMYWVDGDRTAKQKYCFSMGPPFFYWSRFPLFNIPNKQASRL